MVPFDVDVRMTRFVKFAGNGRFDIKAEWAVSFRSMFRERANLLSGVRLEVVSGHGIDYAFGPRRRPRCSEMVSGCSAGPLSRSDALLAHGGDASACHRRRESSGTNAARG